MEDNERQITVTLEEFEEYKSLKNSLSKILNGDGIALIIEKHIYAGFMLADVKYSAKCLGDGDIPKLIMDMLTHLNREREWLVKRHSAISEIVSVIRNDFPQKYKDKLYAVDKERILW